MNNGYEIRPRKEAFKEGIVALTGLATSVVSDVLGRTIGAVNILPVNKSPVSVCGNAVTVSVRSGDNLMIHKALQILQPSDVLVVDGGGDVSRALFGEIMMTVAKSRGAIGVVFDAAIRDVEAFEKHHFPCWARGVNMRGPYKDGPGSINVPVSIGGMVVHPGDVILGDGDGIIALAPELVLEAARLGKEKETIERKTIQSIHDGKYDDAWVDASLKQKGVL
ncbi:MULTISPECIES: RraA family protein [unclassified Polynucleobacter]|uniref:RraA family protein n=1 Tax=unclassified Polynucleobacter TaxID=2640945 RepID=UPI001BFDAC4B|nr:MULTISPECIES: RraA family protein [unclassified Polynucleobacter]QWD69582.1 RraA family protein [Polynucleobacter sp. UB-Siik-W21]QWE05760.1 RraA family protein [Polynucleobacter sp. JS-JIR-5-A7]